MLLQTQPGQLDDLPAINGIYNHYVKTSNATFDTVEWSEQQRSIWFEQFKQQPSSYNLVVAKLDNELVGFAYNSKFKERPAYSTSSESTVYVKSSTKQKGIGNALYEALFSIISTSQLHRIYAVITLPNIASIRLHEKFGFNAVGTMHEVGFKNDQFHSTIMLEKSLVTEPNTVT